jgi:hypothetical protein
MLPALGVVWNASSTHTRPLLCDLIMITVASRQQQGLSQQHNQSLWDCTATTRPQTASASDMNWSPQPNHLNGELPRPHCSVEPFSNTHNDLQEKSKW